MKRVHSMPRAPERLARAPTLAWTNAEGIRCVPHLHFERELAAQCVTETDLRIEIDAIFWAIPGILRSSLFFWTKKRECNLHCNLLGKLLFRRRRFTFGTWLSVTGTGNNRVPRVLKNRKNEMLEPGNETRALNAQLSRAARSCVLR